MEKSVFGQKDIPKKSAISPHISSCASTGVSESSTSRSNSNKYIEKEKPNRYRITHKDHREEYIFADHYKIIGEDLNVMSVIFYLNEKVKCKVLGIIRIDVCGKGQ